MSKHVTFCTWDEVPHLSEESKRDLEASIPPYQREARSKGIPALGSGAIYPVAESDFVVNPFEIPAHWPKCFGLDVGWNWTAAIWGALDRQTDTLYLYSDYLRSEGGPDIHASAIRARGDWIPGAIDPAANGRSQVDGQALMQLYRRLGLDIVNADNDVETGLYEVWIRLSSGRLKAFKSLRQYIEEFRIYRRDAKGRIVKQRDHLMDAKRYMIMTALKRAKVKPVPRPAVSHGSGGGGDRGWMA